MGEKSLQLLKLFACNPECKCLQVEGKYTHTIFHLKTRALVYFAELLTIQFRNEQKKHFDDTEII